MIENETKIVMIADHLWNPNPFCSAYAHDGENGYIKCVEGNEYVVMLNSKWSPDKPEEYHEHRVEVDRADRYFKVN